MAQYGGLDTTKFPWLQKKKPIDTASAILPHDTLGNITLQQTPNSPSFNPATVYRTYIAMGRADSSMVDRVLATAYSKLGAHYKFGGKGPNAFDCAGFTRWVYLHYDIVLAPSAGAQFPQGKAVKDTRKLRPGDLVFYGARRKNHSIGHVGLVVEVDSVSGDFRFIHSSTSLGVTVSSSREPYYAQRYISACRILDEGAWVSPNTFTADSLASVAAQYLEQARRQDSLLRAKAYQDSVRLELDKRLKVANEDLESHKKPHQKSPVLDLVPLDNNPLKPEPPKSKDR